MEPERISAEDRALLQRAYAVVSTEIRKEPPRMIRCISTRLRRVDREGHLLKMRRTIEAHKAIASESPALGARLAELMQLVSIIEPEDRDE